MWRTVSSESMHGKVKGSEVQRSALRAKKGWSTVIWRAELLKLEKPITFYTNLQN